MDKSVLLTVLILLHNAVQYVSCIRLNIIPSLDTPCPGEATEEPCLTLQQYIANSSFSSWTNITLELHPGEHHLNSRLSASSTNSFTMRAVTTASVLCSPSSYFSFNQLQHLYISSVAFTGCTMNLNSIMNASLVKNSFVSTTAGAVNVYRGRVYIRSSNFSGITAGGYGGAIRVRYGEEVTIDSCYFSNNSAGYTGDAIYVYNGVSVTISNSLFINNIITGAIGVSRGDVTISNSNFSGNGVSTRGYGGGAVNVNQNEGVNVSIVNCYFSNNAVGGHGGAIYVQSGGQVTIDSCCFSNNSVGGGGYNGDAIFSSGVTVTISNSLFKDNTASGAIGISRGDLTITNSYFLDNSGADVYLYEGGVNITTSYFSDNAIGGRIAVNIRYGRGVIISKSYFCDNTTETNNGHSRALSIQADGGSITVTNNTFMKRASGEGGMPIFPRGHYTSISLTGNTISYNTTAAYCGLLDVESYNCHISSTLATTPQESMFHMQVLVSIATNLIIITDRVLSCLSL